MERTELLLASDAQTRARLQTEFDDRRVHETLAVADQGRLVPATDYINAQRLRRKMRHEFNQVWQEVDCLIVPATPTPAPAAAPKGPMLQSLPPGNPGQAHATPQASSGQGTLALSAR